MSVNWGRIGIIAILTVATAGLLTWWLMPSPIPVETAKVTSGRFVATVDEDGKAQIRNRYVVEAPLAGRSARIRLKVGDQVSHNDLITTIEPPAVPLLDSRSRREAEERLGTAEAARERARATVERTQAQAAQAQTDLTRAKTLVERNALTTQALERAELAMRVADRELRAAEFLDHASEHEVNQARALLARYGAGEQPPSESWNVTAPVAGVILKVFRESAAIVAPGTPLVEVGDSHDLEIVVDVLSTAAVEIMPGSVVSIERWGGAGNLAGSVRRVEPVAFTKVSTLGVEEQRVNVIIDIVSPRDAWKQLGDGYRLEARISVLTREDALIVPTGALFRTGSQWQVYVVSNGRAEIRPVEVLRRSGHLAAISSGLAAGEEIIIYPGDRVKPGASVQRL
jgi:HlyD family secretion protein